MHAVDLFSGYSMVYICASNAPTCEDTINLLKKWSELFGRMPVVLFTDHGSEFTGHKLSDFLGTESEHLFSAPQAPYSNGVNERHNGLLKVWLAKLSMEFPTLADFPDVLREAVRVKNVSTRRRYGKGTLVRRRCLRKHEHGHAR